jgi:hypothetical protein
VFRYGLEGKSVLYVLYGQLLRGRCLTIQWVYETAIVHAHVQRGSNEIFETVMSVNIITLIRLSAPSTANDSINLPILFHAIDSL